MKVNDTVLYGVHGVCKIVEKEIKKIGGSEREYFVLKPIFDRSTKIYVPAWNEALIAKMKRILSAEEIHAMIRLMPEEDLLWVENEADRKRIYQEVLVSGDREQLIRLIKTLYVCQQKRLAQKKALLLSDERFMKDAERILYEEFAYVLKIEKEQVLPLIIQEIQVEEK